MSEDSQDTFETPTNSRKATLSLKRKTCPAKLECKTPKLDLDTPLKPSFSTSRRFHRLSENQKAQLKQRRLEFQAANSERSTESHKDLNSLSKDELIELIKKSEEELVERSEHERKVKDLKQNITIWKNGLNQALCDLQSQLKSKQEKDLSKRDILKQLNAPPDVYQYLNGLDD